MVLSPPRRTAFIFHALFLLAYRKFIRDAGWGTVFLLSFSMAAMIYSKYQAVLVIGFTILSNLKLLKSIRFWLAGIFALVLLIPHYNWQVANDFQSFQYHLVDRSEDIKLGCLLGISAQPAGSV